MKRIALATLLLLAGILLQERVHAQTGIIPKPVNVRETGRTIDLPQSVVIGSNDAELLRLADLFVSRLERDGFSGLSTAKSLRKATVKLSIDPALAEEGYTLDSTSDKEEILLAGGSVKGVWWGLQTLEQLLVAATENPAQMRIPALRIEDAPRFAYRGAHLDCGRHFFTTDEVKTYIDIISAHKINTFHWHLTEDQGWRIEIKKYPELTRIGSQRPETYVGHLYAHTGKYDGTPHGGYYTQDEIRDIVAYAAERQITIIPEIEMPGHAVAALASYPWLGCRGEGYEVWTSWGVNKDIFCVGKETTFEFLQNVLDEVCDLFPGEYIHIGGDEAPRDSWKTCPHCQKRMKELGLEKEAQLQSYLVARIEKYLNAKGRKIIGWDEILEGGVTPTATVMSWRGAEGGIAAAKQGNDAIMVPLPVPLPRLFADARPGRLRRAAGHRQRSDARKMLLVRPLRRAQRRGACAYQGRAGQPLDRVHRRLRPRAAHAAAASLGCGRDRLEQRKDRHRHAAPPHSRLHAAALQGTRLPLRHLRILVPGLNAPKRDGNTQKIPEENGCGRRFGAGRTPAARILRQGGGDL